jgi:hypothetical protein
MEEQQFYTQLNTAKQQFGDLRNRVGAAVRKNSVTHKALLFQKIVETIHVLTASRHFFKMIGKVCEVDVFIIGYQSLQARLDSS